MKRYTLYIIALVGALACQREIAPQEPVIASGERFTATLEATRTAISSDTSTGDCFVSWTAGDAAKVYYGSTSTLATVDGVSATGYDAANLSATFQTTATIPDNVADLYAVYPSSAASSFTSGTSTLSVTIPSTQTATFQAANYMVAKGSRADHTLPFHHLASYLEIKVSGASVDHIVIAGENGEAIAGTLPVTFNGAGVPNPGIATSTATSITLNVSGVGNYYAALLPGVTFSKGLSIRFYDSDGNILNSYCHQNTLTTARAHIDYFTDASGIDGRSRYFYATVSGAGDMDGSSWANAMSQTELYEFLNNAKLKQNGVLTVLTDAQKNALDGATVRLGAGTYTMTNCVNLQNICTTTNKTFSLVGGYPAAGGATANPSVNVTAISGEDSYRLLTCYVKNTEKKLTLNISGITFCHSYAEGGGAAAVSFFGGGNSVMISNCVFSDNNNTASIAGLHIADGSVVRVENSQFLRNTAWAGAAANVDGADAEGYFTDCVFSDNQSTRGSGGACKLSETATGVMNFTNCTFTANKGNDYGGAFYCNAPESASATFTDCTFGAQNDATKKNYADTHGGGAVYIGDGGTACTITFDGCNFYGNTAKSGGGAIHVSNGLNASSATCLSNVNLTNCTFEGNSVSKDASTMPNGCGGAVDFRSSGTLNITGCTFKQNYTTQIDGTNGYLFSGGAVCISDGNLGSGATPAYATVNISGTTFEGNHTATTVQGTYHMNCGGGLAVICGNNGTANRKAYSKVYVDKCNFLDNYANQGGAFFAGGGGYSNGVEGTTFFNDCLFDGNYILYSYGTTINLCNGGTVCINNSTFHNSYTTRAATIGQWRCWINFNATNFLLANSSVVGQTQGSSGDTGDDTGSNPSLIRFDSSDYNSTYWAAFQNNIIINTKATNSSSAYYSLVNNSTAKMTRDNDSPWSGFRPFMSNKITHVCQNGQGFDTTKPGGKGGTYTNAAYFTLGTDIKWISGSPRTYQNCYFAYNTCPDNNGMATLANCTNDVTKDYKAFGDWLSTSGIDGFSKDQTGATRPSTIKAGAVQAGF